MTISPPAELVVAPPRVSNYPEYLASAGSEAVELAASAGLFLDPWQAWILERALGERADGKWSAFEVALVVPRQNGKGAVLEARELAGLFLFGEQLILHSAHEFKTAAEAFRRVLQLVQSSPDLERRVRTVRTSHGEEGIELKTGARLRFVARSTGSGRGFSGDCIILDEAYNLDAKAMAALLPTLSARPNPQLWYTSSAGMDTSEQLRRVRERGTGGGDPALAYFEYSAEPDALLDDPQAWADANPAKGIRISDEFIERERAALPEVEFARERLGIWDDGRHEQVIDPAVWAAGLDPDSQPTNPVAFAVDVTPDRRRASIAVAGARADGLLHVEVIENNRGTDWVADMLGELKKTWNPCAIGIDPRGPAGSLMSELAELDVTEISQMTQACGGFYDDATQGRLRHIGQALLSSALGAARQRPVGDAWAWHRKDSTDISPLVAVTLARYAFLNAPKAPVFIPRRIR